MVTSFAVIILATTIAPANAQKITCPTGAAFSGDGKWFLDNDRSLYEVATGERVVWEQPPVPAISDPLKDAIRFHGTVAINYDGSTVVYSRGYGPHELSRRVTYTVKGKGGQTDVGAPGFISFSDDGRWMATRCHRGTIIYDIRRSALSKYPVRTCGDGCLPLFSANGRYCIASRGMADEAGKPRPEALVVLDTEKNFAEIDLEPTKFHGTVRRQFNEDGSLLLAYTRSQARVFEFDQNGKLTQKAAVSFKEAPGQVEHVGLSRGTDGLRLLVSGRYFGDDRRWELQSWTLHGEKPSPKVIVTDKSADNTVTAINRQGTRLLYCRRYYNEGFKPNEKPYRWKWQLMKLENGTVDISDVQISGTPVFHPNGKQFVAYEVMPEGSDARPPLALFDAEDGKLIRRFGEAPSSGC